MPEEKSERYKNIKILISASDRDNTDKGWAGVAYGVAEQRVKIILAEGIDPKKLHGRTQVQADITIVSRYQKGKKQYIPTLIELEAIQP
ncbi:MAG: hypothetical protein WAO12_07685 [Venatoribacter sp.]